MATITFDTLKLARKLEAAGFPQRQAADTAEALAGSLGEVSDLATKADLAELKAELKADMAELRAEIRAELNTHLRWLIGTMIGVAVLASPPRSCLLRPFRAAILDCRSWNSRGPRGKLCLMATITFDTLKLARKLEAAESRSS